MTPDETKRHQHTPERRNERSGKPGLTRRSKLRFSSAFSKSHGAGQYGVFAPRCWSGWTRCRDGGHVVGSLTICAPNSAVVSHTVDASVRLRSAHLSTTANHAVTEPASAWAHNVAMTWSWKLGSRGLMSTSTPPSSWWSRGSPSSAATRVDVSSRRRGCRIHSRALWMHCQFTSSAMRLRRRYGIRTRDITLLPLPGLAPTRADAGRTHPGAVGGACRTRGERGDRGVALRWLQASGLWESVDRLGVAIGGFAERIIVANAMLTGFNVLSAFPMDGGRVLRALLATRMEYPRATQRAAMIGQGMAIVFGFLGLQGSPMLIFNANCDGDSGNRRGDC